MNMNQKVCSFLLLACLYAYGQPNAIPTPPSDSSQMIADRIINAKKPVLIDFWAVWCGPCRMLNPIIKQLEAEYKGRVEFIKVNVDIHRGIANYFGVSAIPAVFIVKNKAVVDGDVGLHPIDDYRAELDKALAPAPKPAVPSSPSVPASQPAVR